MKRVFVQAWTVAVLLCAATGYSQEAEYVPPPAPRSVPRTPLFAPDAAKNVSRLSREEREERGFLRSIAASSQFEAQASALALAKSTDPKVRAFATALVDHHKATRVELTRLLHVRGMALPMLDNEHRRVLKRLGRLSGSKFDREYVAQVGLRYRTDDLRQFEKASLNTRDPALKAWVDRQLPALRYHVVLAGEKAGGSPKTADRAKTPRPQAGGRDSAAAPVRAPRMGAGPRPAPTDLSGSSSP